MNNKDILKLAEIFREAAKKKKSKSKSKSKSGGSKSGYEPTDKAKWNAAKAKAKRKFDVYPSAYANLWASKEYKRMGGGWKKKTKTKKKSSFEPGMVRLADGESDKDMKPLVFVKYHGPHAYEKNEEIFKKTEESAKDGDEHCQKIMDKYEELMKKYIDDRDGKDVDYDDSDLEEVMKECEDHLKDKDSDSNNVEWSDDHNSLVSEADLREWLKEDWVRIDRKDNPPCGRSDADKGDYPKCRPRASANKMSKKDKASASRRKEQAEKKPRKGKKPNYVSTKAKGKKKTKKKSSELFIDAFTILAAKKKKKKGLKPAADGMMKGKKHPWQACYNKMKDKVDSPEAFCAKMKDVHKGTTDWRSTEGLNKKKKKKSKDKNDSCDSMVDSMLALDYSPELEKSFLKSFKD